jgi:hypothetical protein
VKEAVRVSPTTTGGPALRLAEAGIATRPTAMAHAVITAIAAGTDFRRTMLAALLVAVNGIDVLASLVLLVHRRAGQRRRRRPLTFMCPPSNERIYVDGCGLFYTHSTLIAGLA